MAGPKPVRENRERYRVTEERDRDRKKEGGERFRWEGAMRETKSTMTKRRKRFLKVYL